MGNSNETKPVDKIAKDIIADDAKKQKQNGRPGKGVVSQLPTRALLIAAIVVIVIVVTGFVAYSFATRNAGITAIQTATAISRTPVAQVVVTNTSIAQAVATNTSVAPVNSPTSTLAPSPTAPPTLTPTLMPSNTPTSSPTLAPTATPSPRPLAATAPFKAADLPRLVLQKSDAPAGWSYGILQAADTPPEFFGDTATTQQFQQLGVSSVFPVRLKPPQVCNPVCNLTSYVFLVDNAADAAKVVPALQTWEAQALGSVEVMPSAQIKIHVPAGAAPVTAAGCERGTFGGASSFTCAWSQANVVNGFYEQYLQKPSALDLGTVLQWVDRQASYARLR